jgi:hypothetical protein
MRSTLHLSASQRNRYQNATAAAAFADGERGRVAALRRARRRHAACTPAGNVSNTDFLGRLAMPLLRRLIASAFVLAAASSTAMADDNVSVTVNGRTYQCSGGGGGGNPSPVNLCRCRREAYSGQDYDYYLEKYTPSTGQYTQLQSFRSTAQDNGESDRVACESARNDPACYFSASQLEKALQSLDER